MRNRLIELLEEENGLSRYITADERRERIADHLIANGVVIIDPVKYPPVTNREIIDQVMGMPLDEMADLIKAKQEGRIIVSPCKVGDTVYMPWEWGGTKGVAILEITRIVLDFTHRPYVNTNFFSDDEEYWCAYNCGRFAFDDFGKTVFLTKEEAEKALAERSEA